MVTPERVLTVQTVRPWLEAIFPGGRDVPTITPLVADASTRRYWRVRLGTARHSRPVSCIMMLGEPWSDTETPDFLAVGNHLRLSGVNVPRVYGALPSQGVMFLEDFGDLTLAAHWRRTAADERLAWGWRAVDELVKLHTVGSQEGDPACPAFRLAFDVPKLLSELQFFRQHAIEGLWSQQLTDAEGDELDRAFGPLCTFLASQPRYFCHRDYHGWNIMVLDRAVGVLDFQDARMGPLPYDLVSLVCDRGTAGMLGPEVVQALVDHYLHRLHAEGGPAMGRHDFLELFDYVAVQRGLKAIGTFAYMTVVHGRRQYLPYIPPTLTAIKPLLRRHSLLRPLAHLLHRYVPSWGG
jgi:aminoglycoside/choline kinase family phosphotransferase